MAEKGWLYREIKVFDHLELVWINGKGYQILDTNYPHPLDTLIEFGDEKYKALAHFDQVVFDHLKVKILKKSI
ncbi:hypothetical protein AWH56_009045 [Anaerobacillus isosaccharinicus]|uniref:Uncharacterized protein n=1 Tax=Anaerobacillus isosaccharinicus TaxID=1532552 RepID=A0A1S2MDR5_9BACI|nr:hypothetical protein [Anaerobacillus isosaccharinicus]MBA5588898.1 hypothetical protein [Anaerobacillus isosaccharinicus]QOY37708.1 hypothetical protein AWH56_009045 [Anaerobacillus isosaccharinicus]